MMMKSYFCPILAMLPRIHSTIFRRDSAFMFPCAVHSCVPLAIHSSYFLVMCPLKGLFQDTSGGWLFCASTRNHNNIDFTFRKLLFNRISKMTGERVPREKPASKWKLSDHFVDPVFSQGLVHPCISRRGNNTSCTKFFIKWSGGCTK